MSSIGVDRRAPWAGARSFFIRHVLMSEYLVLYLCVAYFVLVSPWVDGMATWSTAYTILSAMLPLLVVAVGQTVVLIVAGIDLSVTAVIAFASVVGASVMTGDDGYLGGSVLAVPVGILVFLAVGALIGLFNGVCSTKLRMPSFIVTLTTMMFFSGLAIWYNTAHTETSSIANLPHAFNVIGGGTLFGIPIPLFVAAAIAIAVHLMLSRTLFGRWIYAIGRNREAARISGVPVDRVILWVFILCGTLAAVSSILYTGRLETGTPVLGRTFLLDIVGAAVIGGTSLFGGKGKVLWTVFGVLFLSMMGASLNLVGLGNDFAVGVKGVVILLAAMIDAARQRVMARQ
jgi:ribose/xylose/arabinose/galactoside ABC-type transport system permease subunit